MKHFIAIFCALICTFSLLCLSASAATFTHPKSFEFTWNVWKDYYKTDTLNKLYTLSSTSYKVTAGQNTAYGTCPQAYYDNTLFFCEHDIIYLKNGSTHNIQLMGDNYTFICEEFHLEVLKNGAFLSSTGRDSVHELDHNGWRFIPLIYFKDDTLNYSWWPVDTISYNGTQTLNTGEFCVNATSSPLLSYVCDYYSEENTIYVAGYYSDIGLVGSGGTSEAPSGGTSEAPSGGTSEAPSGGTSEAPSGGSDIPYDEWEDDKNTVTGAFDFLKNAGNGLSSFFSAVFSFLPASVVGLIAAAVVLIIIIGVVKALL